METVDRHNNGHAEFKHIFNMCFKVYDSLFKSLNIFICQLSPCHSAVIFECTDSCHQHNTAWFKSCKAALDVKELFCAKVRAEACLGDGIVCKFKAQLCCSYRVAAVCDICKGAAVHYRRCVFKGLHKVWFESIFKQCGHSAAAAQLLCVDSLSVKVVAYEYAFKALFEVVKVACKAKDSHYLGGNGYLEAILSGEAVYLSAQTHNYLTQCTVVHIHTSFEKDTSFIKAQRIALVDRVIYQRTQQVVCRCDSVHIARKVQIDVLHRNYLCISAACGTALDAEYRTQRWLTQCKDSLFAYLRHRLCKTYGDSRFALARRGRVDSGDKYQLAVGLVLGFLVKALGELCLIVTVGLKVLLAYAELSGDLANFEHFRLLCDLDI